MSNAVEILVASSMRSNEDQETGFLGALYLVCVSHLDVERRSQIILMAERIADSGPASHTSFVEDECVLQHDVVTLQGGLEKRK